MYNFSLPLLAVTCRAVAPFFAPLTFWHVPQLGHVKTGDSIAYVKPSSPGWLIAAGAYPGYCSIKRLEVFLLPLDGMLVHRRSLPCNFVRFPQQIASTHLHTWVERGTVRVKCLAQEHNTLSPARARTQTARSGVERTNHEATAHLLFTTVDLACHENTHFICKDEFLYCYCFLGIGDQLWSFRVDFFDCCVTC